MFVLPMVRLHVPLVAPHRSNILFGVEKNEQIRKKKKMGNILYKRRKTIKKRYEMSKKKDIISS